MWFLKDKAISAWNATKGMLDSRSPVEKTIDEIADSQD
jgi:hypothetical protein